MNDLNKSDLRKISYIANSSILFFVFVLQYLFWYEDVTYMFYHSIPTAMMYILFFRLIQKRNLKLFSWLLYITMGIYMSAATICLGYETGFYVYCMSLIPIIGAQKYMAFKVNKSSMHFGAACAMMMCFYFGSLIVSVINGPVYSIDKNISTIILMINSGTVFLFLIMYSNIISNSMIAAETRLRNAAEKDHLTGLNNRNVMTKYLEELRDNEKAYNTYWLAMVDIDDFKCVNDTYGHNVGDVVLTSVAKKIENCYQNAKVSRWGGEEFLIVANINEYDIHSLEGLRKSVDESRIMACGNDLHVTITVGVSQYIADTQKWIQKSDERLYKGKANGKNCVIDY